MLLGLCLDRPCAVGSKPLVITVTTLNQEGNLDHEYHSQYKGL
jgi:hypothetical protein